MKPRRLQLSLRRRARADAAEAPAHAYYSWRPLTLCWKRAAPRVAPPGQRILPRMLRQVFHTQVHLHLPQSAHHLSEHTWHSTSAVHAAPATPRVNLTQFALRQVTRSDVIMQPVRERSRRESVLRTERSHFDTRDVRATRVVHYTGAQMSTTASKPRSTPPLAPALHAARAATMNWGTFARLPVRATTQAEATDPAAQWPARSAATLVWRLPSTPQAAPKSGESFIGHTAAPRTPDNFVPRASQATSIAALPAQIQNFARETQRALLLDASLTERLAEDVLKKVDKRLRIERERRGL